MTGDRKAPQDADSPSLTNEDFKIAIDLWKHQDTLYWNNLRFYYLVHAGTIGAALSFSDENRTLSIMSLLAGVVLSICFITISEKHSRDRDARNPSIFAYFDAREEVGRFLGPRLFIPTVYAVRVIYALPLLLNFILIWMKV